MAVGEHPTISREACPHLEEVDAGAADSDAGACEVCGESHHLRICLTCGFVGCCESKHGHDRDHFQETGHPLIRPHGQDYDFLWCYGCRAYLE